MSTRSIVSTPRWSSRVVAIASIPLALAACTGGDEGKSADKGAVDDATDQAYLVGIRAEDFVCESLFSIEEATKLFGGRVKQVESPHSPPLGVPGSCNFESFAEGRAPMRWSFDLDCRDGAHSDAAQLMVQYAEAPEATPMRLGRSALDHNGSALLFIDDDTPCYGRVLGPGRDIRKQIAELLIPRLEPSTAPTGQHLVVTE